MAIRNCKLRVYLGHKLPLINCGNIQKFIYELDTWRKHVKLKVKINICILNNLIPKNIMQEKSSTSYREVK